MTEERRIPESWEEVDMGDVMEKAQVKLETEQPDRFKISVMEEPEGSDKMNDHLKDINKRRIIQKKDVGGMMARSEERSQMVSDEQPEESNVERYVRLVDCIFPPQMIV